MKFTGEEEKLPNYLNEILKITQTHTQTYKYLFL